ncbi:type IV pilus modification PilV family protein [Aliamphritea ceti]|uniref:type IV pilus modification PilV family protein n=1 Tax=Aliamphritea ceti TaxID=1524258 RepID=UPI0021C40E74|nr:type II secretion system protein [Aliamphritea ceti]
MANHSKPFTRQAGFTLLEVLVAFLLLSIALTLIMNIFSGSMHNQVTGAEYRKALQHAESRIADVTSETTLRPGRDQGWIDDKYRWEVEIEDWQYPDYDPAEPYELEPLSISVTVIWGDVKERQVRLHTVKLIRTEPL